MNKGQGGRLATSGPSVACWERRQAGTAAQARWQECIATGLGGPRVRGGN
jgi:hypothetical protein